MHANIHKYTQIKMKYHKTVILNASERSYKFNYATRCVRSFTGVQDDIYYFTKFLFACICVHLRNK